MPAAQKKASGVNATQEFVGPREANPPVRANRHPWADLLSHHSSAVWDPIDVG